MSFDVHRPFTRAEALAAGLTDRQLSGPRFRGLLRGVHISAAVPPHPAHRAAAALMVHPPGAVLSHTSAARLVRAPVPDDGVEHVTVPAGDQRRRHREIRCHVAALAATEIGLLNGLRITRPHRMFLDLSSMLGLVDLVVLGDWLVRQGHTTRQGLTEHLRRTDGRHVRHARRAAAYVRERVDSPMETRLRMLIVLAGLPEPVVNAEVRDVFGVAILRLDLSYPGLRLAVEYDGRHHVELVEQWERDHERRDDLEADGWRLLVVTSKGIFREPERTLERIWQALRSRGMRRLPRPHDGWRPYFR